VQDMILCNICRQEHKADETCPAGEELKKDLFIGRVLEGKYRLEQVIGRGGMGSVYGALRRQIGDLVAIKVLKIDENLDPTDLKRFQLEAATAASIKHQNIISIHDFGLLEDIAYLVMECLEGPPLSQEIRKYKTLSPERSLCIFKQVSAAVAAAHKQGVVHRDLKPSNIIFQHAGCEDDLIKVVDFGIAKLIRNPKEEKLTAANIAIGTPEYMSPEQSMGQRLDERSDIYSLGIVLYEMLTGNVPFYNPVPSAILLQHALDPPRAPSRLNPNIPPEIDAVVLKALEKNPEKRYQSALEMATEFELSCRSAALANRNLSAPAGEQDVGQSRAEDERTHTVSLTKRAPLPFNPGFANAPKITKMVKKEREPVRFSFDRFIGREVELKRLKERFEQARSGRGRVSFIIGDAGCGKTELANQFQRALGAGTALFLAARFYEFSGDNSPFRPYLDCLFSFTRNFPKRKTGEWTDEVEQLPAKIRPVLDEVDSLIDLSSMQGPSAKEQSKYRAFELLTEVFVIIAELTPVVLFLDDIHWADALSLEFLAYLARNTEENRMFVLCTLRGQELLDETQSIKIWLRQISLYSNFDQIKLALLSDKEVNALIHSIFGNIKISEGVIHRLYETAQGNPLYLGEILRQLIQEQKIVWSGDRWQCADIEEIDLPGSVLDLVELHLKRLNDEMLDVFTRAAVVGEKFSLKLLSRITDIPKDALMDIIDVGLREFIIKESTVSNPSADDHFAFYHGTLRKALYERVSNYRRRRLHAQVGEKLENLYPRRLERVASELAYHFYHGGNYHKALYYGVAAGETARSVFAIEEVPKYFSWADESLRQIAEAGETLNYEPDRLIDFRLSYGNVLMHLGRNEGACEQFELGLNLSREAALAPLQGKILRAMGELSWSRGHYREAIELCESSLKLLSEAGDASGHCRLFCIIGNAYFSQGQHDQAIEYYNRSLELSRQIKESASEGEALRNIALILARSGHPLKALGHLDQALAIAGATNDRESERQILMLIGNIYYEQGELEKAAEHYEQSRVLARTIGRRRGECRVLLNMGEICRRQEEFQEAKSYFKEAYTIATEIQDRESQCHTLSNLGLVYQKLGELDPAIDCFEEALNIFKQTNYRSDAEVEALSGMANILWQKDRVVEAKGYFEKAVAIGRELSLWHLVLPGLRCLSACELALGQSQDARQHLIEARAAVNILAAEQSEAEQEYFRQILSELNKEIADLTD
jgi:serine/threonine protein kinase/Tfp pilus assembly protein PilF